MEPAAVLSHFYAFVVQEATIGSSHISLYMALYQLWSCNKLATPILVRRKEVMKLAKIGSPATYHRCLKQLIEVGCIKYEPFPNPALKSKLYLVIKDQPEKDRAHVGAQP
jgi:hypothetical protein